MNLWNIYGSVLVFGLGLCWGSFLNVCIYRIPRGKSVVWPPSGCPKCGNCIRGFDNIPLLSWCFLAGKCRSCKGAISIAYPLIEFVTGVLFLAIWWVYGLTWMTPIYALAVFGLLLGTFIDIAEMWIPDRVTIGGMILFPLFSMWVPELHGVEGWIAGLMASLIGMVTGFGLFWLIGFLGKRSFKKEAMGLGDVKLMGGLGALFGWQAVLFILFFSALVGSIVGVVLMVMKKKERLSQIPYGPYLALAAFVWLFSGYQIWNAYLVFLGF